MDLSTQLAPYLPALLALTTLCLMVLLQALLTAPLAFVNGEQAPGAPLQGDHSQRSFRVLRTHLNSVESLSPLGFALLIALAAGVGSTLVNWLAVIHVAFRLAFWLVYYAGIGKVAGGLRTMCYIGGMVSNLVLVIATLVKLLG